MTLYWNKKITREDLQTAKREYCHAIKKHFCEPDLQELQDRILSLECKLWRLERHDS